MTRSHHPLSEKIKTSNREITENIQKSHSQTWRQRDNILPIKTLPDPRLIIGLTLVVGSFLFVVAIYYGIINP